MANLILIIPTEIIKTILDAWIGIHHSQPGPTLLSPTSPPGFIERLPSIRLIAEE